MKTLKLILALVMIAAAGCEEGNFAGEKDSASDSFASSDSQGTDSDACTVYMAPGDTDNEGDGSTAAAPASTTEDALYRAESLQQLCGDNVEVRILEGSASDAAIKSAESELKSAGYKVTRTSRSALNNVNQSTPSTGAITADSPAGVNDAITGNNLLNQTGAVPLNVSSPWWEESGTSNNIFYDDGTVSIIAPTSSTMAPIFQLQGGNDVNFDWAPADSSKPVGTSPRGQLNLRSGSGLYQLFMDSNEIDAFVYTSANKDPDKWKGNTLNINGNSKSNVQICRNGGSVTVGGSAVTGTKLLVQGATVKSSDITTYGTLRIKDTTTNSMVFDANQIESTGGIYLNHYSTTNVTMVGGGGNVAIGNIAAANVTHKLTVDGAIKAEQLLLDNVVGADFVFEENYNLMCIDEVEKFVEEHNHLPGIASAADMQQNGVSMGEFQIQLLQKIEELTLYMIEQNKRIKDLEQKCGQ